MFEYQLSQYAIISQHTYSKDEVFSKLVYQTSIPSLFAIPVPVIEQIQNGSWQKIETKTLKDLLAHRIITSSSTDERKQVLSSINKSSHSISHRIFVLMPTSLCNMECSYCGQSTCPLRYHGNISENVDQRILTAIMNANVTDVEVRWFGGEPMMAYQHIIESSARYIAAARQSRTHYKSIMTSNGSLMTIKRLQELYQRAALRMITVTVDGYRDYHNRSRCMRNGRPTYDYIMEWMQKSLAIMEQMPKLTIAIRVNITTTNACSITHFIDDLARRHLNNPHFILQLIPVYNWGHDNTQIQLDNTSLDRNMCQWIEQAIAKGIQINILPNTKKDFVCVATNRQAEVIDSRGFIYSCTEFPLVKPYENMEKLANIQTLPPNNLRPNSIFDTWRNLIQNQTFPCGNCPWLPVCGGACPKRWIEGEKPCPPFTKQINSRFDILARQFGYSLIS